MEVPKTGLQDHKVLTTSGRLLMFAPTTSPVTARPSRRILALVLAFAATLFFGVMTTGSAEAAPRTKPSISVPVVGETETGLPVKGTYKITRFATQGGELVARGTFIGTVGEIGDASTVRKAVTIPVTGATAEEGAVQALQTCDILNLVLGPLDLNLLGLRVSSTRWFWTSPPNKAPGTCSETCSVQSPASWTGHRR